MVTWITPSNYWMIAQRHYPRSPYMKCPHHPTPPARPLPTLNLPASLPTLHRTPHSHPSLARPPHTCTMEWKNASPNNIFLNCGSLVQPSKNSGLLMGSLWRRGGGSQQGSIGWGQLIAVRITEAGNARSIRALWRVGHSGVGGRQAVGAGALLPYLV